VTQDQPESAGGPVYRTSDLAGCDVATEAGEILGRLTDVLPSRGNDVWVVVGAREYLIPALKEVVLKVDLSARRITVRFPPGLRDVYEA
jgi:16S rRNA processing protein RimM